MTRLGRCRKLIVDTDLGLDDLVALSILRLQQCILEHPSNPTQCANQITNFRICGVTLTSGISVANTKNAALLCRLLPPGTPVYVGNTCTSLQWNNTGTEKPVWWNRTANNVESFLSSLPLGAETTQQHKQLSAEEFIANNLNDPDVDILCMAPLTNVAAAIDLFKEKLPSRQIESRFYIMGGIRNDSRWTRRGESTAPFGYHDIFSGLECTSTETASQEDQFGEFNFALNIGAARKVLASVSAHIIPLEACTLVPKGLRDSEPSINLATVLSNAFAESETCGELGMARSNLINLLYEFGTNETQWDSLSSFRYAISRDDMPIQICRSELCLSDLGACMFPGQTQPDADTMECNNSDNTEKSHFIYPAFTIEDELEFYEFLSHILFDRITNE